MNKRIIIAASIFGMIAVILGAFGAHTLKGRLSSSDLEVWKTAVNYQFYHTFALLFLSTFSRKNSRIINLSAWFFTIGIFLFSGSLYLISTKEILNLSQVGIIGPITPIGGLFFIMGWFSLLIATLKNK
ncbi:DUF423 domain-containing protein [Daejeonella sp.]|jgi:uncharacterized membrane protein YgdD (TMEM256/DUF423 family)|uniref:DUF423 domain-containing protein n=1 Tax=Daejeonella sp. TaxID=2805397 RepID=UPI0037834898